jgi:hypothetical protein
VRRTFDLLHLDENNNGDNDNAINNNNNENTNNNDDDNARSLSDCAGKDGNKKDGTSGHLSTTNTARQDKAGWRS